MLLKSKGTHDAAMGYFDSVCKVEPSREQIEFEYKMAHNNVHLRARVETLEKQVTMLYQVLCGMICDLYKPESEG